MRRMFPVFYKVIKKDHLEKETISEHRSLIYIVFYNIMH